MLVEAKILHIESKSTSEGKPFTVVYYQELDDEGNAFGKPKEVSSFDSEVVRKCHSLVPGEYCRLDLTVVKAYLAGVSKD